MTSTLQARDLLMDRAKGALTGLAVGDAMGLPGDRWPHARLRSTYGWIDQLLPARTGDRTRRAGHVSAGTLEAIAVAEALRDGGGRASEERITDRMDALGDRPRRPVHVARFAPLGIVHTSLDLDALIGDIVICAAPHHLSNAAVAAAALVAGVVTSALDAPIGATGAVFLPAHLEIGFRAAEIGLGHGSPVAAPSVIQRSLLAREIAMNAESDASFLQHLYDVIGTTPAATEVVPAAVGLLVRGEGVPFRVATLAANLGGACTAIGALATAMAGAINGLSVLPPDPVATVRTVNGIGPCELARELAELRH
ncbi:ADP-ribosylglycohydrolase family protein [Occultella kanbiaonis]|uniref:ADP-ribosylglycohydrolase family protein n=1 Tax=Occultella kanbiaonis TaxID=2675754 RepID=UPI0013D720A9|nr:ADP-ribosylglycohydrolase family protein [Occultella kanbiaonis]